MYKEKINFGFGDFALQNKGKNEFLINVKELIDWEAIEKLLKNNLKRGFNAIGNPPYSELLLFRILLLQTWFNLSDHKVEEAINDRISFMKFLNISVESETPDHSTISRFRNSLIKNDLDKKLFLEVNRQLVEKGILVKNGAIIDATIVISSRRPRKQDELIVEDRKEEEVQETKANTETSSEVEAKIVTTYSDDKEASWTKKYKRFLYGYKVHNSVNKEGYVLGGIVTGANVSDTMCLEAILNEITLEEGLSVLADKGYTSAKNSAILESKNLVDKIMLKATKSKKLTEEEKMENKEISKFRFVVEQTFGLLKQHFGFERMRYVGKRKAELEYMLKSLAFNLKKACYSL